MQLRRYVDGIVLGVVLSCSQAQSGTPRVVLVQPSGSRVPANLLRISIRFATQVEGPLLPRIELLRQDGMKIQEPFLQQELWSPDGKVLTVLMHPGRIKHGLRALDQMGPILSEGEEVSLMLDGLSIKRWTVGQRDDVGPIPSAWQASAVHPASREPLMVMLDGPIDGQDAGYIVVADADGRKVAGRARLMVGEAAWMFTPTVDWGAGPYNLVVRGTLEDPAGNRLGSAFETSIDSPPMSAANAVVPLAVRAPQP